MNDFRKILEALRNARAEFILIGGMAGIAHGASRLTEDIDVVYLRTPENIIRVVTALAPYSPYLRGVPPGLPFQWDARAVQRGLNFTLITDLGAIDLLGEITGGGGFEQLLPKCVDLEVFGIPCRCLSLDGLIETKRAVGRPKDLQAIAELQLLREAQRPSD